MLHMKLYLWSSEISTFFYAIHFYSFYIPVDFDPILIVFGFLERQFIEHIQKKNI